MLELVKRIRFVIDTDGFQKNGNYIVKEMGVADMRTGSVDNYYYKVGKLSDLSNTDRVTAFVVTKKVHGMPFADHATDFEQSHVDSHMQYLIEQCRKDCSFIAFKGGHYESDIITRNGYRQFYNLEWDEIPKFAELLNIELIVSRARAQFPQKWPCDRHTGPVVRSPKYSSKSANAVRIYHCPALEVACFAAWCKHYIETGIRLFP